MEWFKFVKADGSIEWVNLLGILGALAILVLTIFIMGVYIKKIKDGKAEGEDAGEDWDGIKEFKNNLPIGWALSFIGVILFFFWYIFIGYPLNTYSQIGEYNEEVKGYNASHQKVWSEIDDDGKKEMGKGIFLVQCSQCHGVVADGMPADGKLKAKNLTKWGKEEGIMEVIQNGSKGLDYGMGEMTPIDISKEESKAVAAYVMSEISNTHKTNYPDLVAQGQEIFAAQCVACHGVDGSGNIEGLEKAASDLRNYGDKVFLAEVLNKGKKGHLGFMPSFNYVNFAPEQIDALNTFIRSQDIIE